MDFQGLAAGYAGYNEGRDAELARRQLVLDREQTARDRVQKGLQDQQNNHLYDLRVSEFDRAKREREALGQAAAPATYSEGPETEAPLADGEMGPGLAQRSYNVNGQNYDTQSAAAAARKAYDSPAAAAARQQGLMSAQGRPGDALALQTQRNNADVSGMQAQAMHMDMAKRLASEGVLTALPFMRSGDVNGMVQALNASGEMKIDPATVKKTMREVDVGGHKMPTYDYEYDIIHPDGSREHKTQNSRELSIQMQPYAETHKQFLEEEKAKEATRYHDINATRYKDQLELARGAYNYQNGTGRSPSGAGKASMDPEMNKQILQRRLELGPRPPVVKNWIMPNDDSAGKAWDEQSAYLDSIVARASGLSPASGGESGGAPPPGAQSMYVFEEGQPPQPAFVGADNKPYKTRAEALATVPGHTDSGKPPTSTKPVVGLQPTQKQLLHAGPKSDRSRSAELAEQRAVEQRAEAQAQAQREADRQAEIRRIGLEQRQRQADWAATHPTRR
jgi:hypothetical protein